MAGERDGHVLAALKNARIHASREEMAKSLQGNWRAEPLFSLTQALDAFDSIGTQLAECHTIKASGLNSVDLFQQIPRAPLTVLQQTTQLSSAFAPPLADATMLQESM